MRPDRYTLRLRTVTLRIADGVTPGAYSGNIEEALAVLRPIFATLDSDQEHLVLLALNAKNHVKGYKVISSGTETSSQVSLPIVFRNALALGAVGIILAHNHPSGDPTPSPDDLAVTRTLAEAGRLLGITVLDHVILGDGTGLWHSMHRQNPGVVR